MTEPRSVARAAAGMGLATAVSRAFGFVRVLVIAAVLGTTYLGNTFQASNSFSNVLFELLAAGALSAVLVPTFVELIDRGEEREAERLAGNVLGRGLAWLGAITVFAVVAAPWIARFLASGADNPGLRDAQVELSTFLLRFFIPQVLLYALGTVAIAALYAKRRFAVTAVAPIGLTVVLVSALLVFRTLAGPGNVSLDLSFSEKLTLALGGTLGVAAFVGVPAVALRLTGFRLRPRFDRGDAAIRRVLRLSGWAVFQHSMIGVLLVTAVVTGNRVEGGVIAYQVAWVFFLAPYAVLAQPIHTTVLPELSIQAGRDDWAAFAGSLRWALDSMAVLVIPVSVAMISLAQPGMRVVAFGEATRGGVALLAAGIASLALGLFVYGAFLLLARAYYALGDSRTPAMVALASALAGAATMAIAGRAVHGSAVVAAIGIGHSVAYGLGAAMLAIGLSRRTGHAIVPTALPRALAVAAPIGLAAWWVDRALDPRGRAASLAMVAVAGIVGGLLYLVGTRGFGGVAALGRGAFARVGSGGPEEADAAAEEA
ncbi:MAG TPA: lipid II flippase MurJ [Actinomycetota bacterium]|nr:lipid II flippase MurJ [Actinomycetota bacterium]